MPWRDIRVTEEQTAWLWERLAGCEDVAEISARIMRVA